MKHRSPLITLAAVAVAFAIMFIVNMLSGPPAMAPPEPRAQQRRRSGVPRSRQRANSVSKSS